MLNYISKLFICPPFPNKFIKPSVFILPLFSICKIAIGSIFSSCLIVFIVSRNFGFSIISLKTGLTSSSFKFSDLIANSVVLLARTNNNSAISLSFSAALSLLSTTAFVK